MAAANCGSVNVPSTIRKSAAGCQSLRPVCWRQRPMKGQRAVTAQARGSNTTRVLTLENVSSLLRSRICRQKWTPIQRFRKIIRAATLMKVLSMVAKARPRSSPAMYR